MPHDDWNVTIPVDHTKIGSVPTEIRDVKSSAKIIISKEHIAPSTDNAGGQHAHGSSRVYLQSGLPALDPEGNNLETTVGPSTNVDHGRLAVDTAASNELRVYLGTSAGIETGWKHVRVGRVKAATDIDANSRLVKNVASGTQTGQAIHVGQVDVTALTGQLKIIEPATGAKVAVAVLDPPTANEHIVGKKYADAHAGHTGGEYYVYRDVDGTPTKVYTKYFTGTLDADSSTSVAHGITGVDNILSVSAAVDNGSSTYLVIGFRDNVKDVYTFEVTYDGTNVNITQVGATVQGEKYKIRIDYVI